jgi:hypothetical protein
MVGQGNIEMMKDNLQPRPLSRVGFYHPFAEVLVDTVLGFFAPIVQETLAQPIGLLN